MPRSSASGRPAKCQCEECHGRRPHPPHGFPWTHYDILNPAVEYMLCDAFLQGFDLECRAWGKAPMEELITFTAPPSGLTLPTNYS